MSRNEERKKQGEILKMFRRLYPIAGVVCFIATLLLMRNPSWAYISASCSLSVLVLGGIALAYIEQKYKTQEARYGYVKKESSFEEAEKPLLIEISKLVEMAKWAVAKIWGRRP